MMKMLEQKDVLDKVNALVIPEEAKVKVMTTILGCQIYEVKEEDVEL